jgi:hypothetical protein
MRPAARTLALLALLAMLLASTATAATYAEADAPGGAYGSRWNAPTEIGNGFDAVTGTGSQNVFDNFVFTGLPSGAQTLRFTFTAPATAGYAYSAGGAILYDKQPFDYGWDGTYAANVQIDYWTPSRTYELALADSFTGRLFLSLNFTHGSELAYTIAVPSNAPSSSPSAVPLPAGAPLIAAGVAALAGLRLRRRRK